MASKGLIKRIRQLQQKKYRKQTNQFVVEGHKHIAEFLRNSQHYEAVHLITTVESETHNTDDTDTNSSRLVVSPQDMSRMTGLSTACDALAVFQKRQGSTGEDFAKSLEKGAQVSLALDAVRDPGNLGTLIRLCDWFGMRNMLLSGDCCDCYNPKVVRATAGSLARVNVHYAAGTLHGELSGLHAPLIGASMEGKSIYDLDLPLKKVGSDGSKSSSNGLVLVMGSEGKGLSPEVVNILDEVVSIPSYPFPDREVDASEERRIEEATESLNVAMAAGILISEIKRRLS